MGRKRRDATYKDWITDEGIIKLEGMARDGLINEEIANRIGIHPSTLYEWQSKYPEIADSLKRGKEVIDRQVENALLKKALGYEYEEVKTYIEKDGAGNEKKKIEKTIKHIAPDATAIIFWLSNRKSNEWRRNANKERLDEAKFEHDKGIDNKRFW